MQRMMIHAPVPERVIPCDLLARAFEYPSGYAAAERTLSRHGWFYVIGEDAWVCGWGMQPHEEKRPAPTLKLKWYTGEFKFPSCI